MEVFESKLHEWSLKNTRLFCLLSFSTPSAALPGWTEPLTWFLGSDDLNLEIKGVFIFNQIVSILIQDTGILKMRVGRREVT